MKTVQVQLQKAVETAIAGIDRSGVSPDALQVVPCANTQFGDYQWNGALPLAKAARQNPRALAQSIVDKLEVGGISAPPEIAGPGFINFRLLTDFIEISALEALHDPRLGVPETEAKRTVIVDYPSPNVAKPLHVGHIRTMFIGDAIARLLRFAGHHVVTDNHIGDWGTPIGKVIFGWKSHRDEAAFEHSPLEEMGRLYKIANEAAENDAAVMDAVRGETAKLQAGDPENRAIWETLRTASQKELDALYARLGIYPDVTLGESFYQDMLAGVVDDLRQRGLAVESEGALIIRFDEPALQDKVMVVQKSDGAALYATTDLATIKYRMDRWQPDEIIYVVDTRQSTHFQELFSTARRWGYDKVILRHITFGSIVGESGKALSSRSGETIALNDLLDEAAARALQTVKDKGASFDETEAREVGRVVGIGAVKYADLSPNRTSDYTFSWNKMLALNGNTAPYLLNAYVRIQSIFRRAASEDISTDVPEQLTLEHEAELGLAKFLLQFSLAIDTALSDYRINALTDYLFELAHKFHNFYEKCPVLPVKDPARSSRLALCTLTAAILKQGLDLLGIETIDRM